MRLHQQRKSQRGTAIIVALFVMTLIAAAAVAMMSRLQVDIQRSASLFNADKANLIAQGSILWGIEQLNNDIRHKKANQLIDAFPLRSTTNEVDGFKVYSMIEDEQSKFNINNLTTPDSIDTFLHLLMIVAPTLEKTESMELVAAIQDWLSPATKNAVTDNDYVTQQPPYQAAHHIMTSVSELRLIRGITAKIYMQLLPYITALPVATKININTASAPILMSLLPNLSLESAKAVLTYREKIPFIDTEKFVTSDIIRKNLTENIKEKITTTSDYFLIKTHVNIADQQLNLYSQVVRSGQTEKPVTTILWQSKGTL